MSLSVYDHVRKKANALGFDLRYTLGSYYIVVRPNYVYSAMQKAVCKGFLFACNYWLELYKRNLVVDKKFSEVKL